MEFGVRLKEILESKGMTQADLSRLSSIGEDHISKLICSYIVVGPIF